MITDLRLVTPNPVLKPTISNIATGRDADLERQLIQKSHQPHILEHTPNDAAKRFTSAEALTEWLQNDRRIYWLVGPKHDLAGIVWFGPKEFPLDMQLPVKPTDTFAIRLYEGYTGKGLANPFLAQAFELEAEWAKGRGELPPIVWGETDADNPAALSTYLKNGFQRIHQQGKRITLVRPITPIKLGESA
jgi:GNAT superfamily N-acetyltransferase